LKTTEQLKQRETEIESLKKKVESLEKQEDEVKDMQLENASLKKRLSQLEEGTEKTRELSKRVSELEKVQGQLEELQQEPEYTKMQVQELEVVKNQVAALLTCQKSMQRLMEKQDEQITKLRSWEAERDTETNSLKKLVKQLQRQNDETGVFVREELKGFREKVVRKFKVTLGKQRLNPAISSFHSTNQLSTRTKRKSPQENWVKALVDPDNAVVRKIRKVEEWKPEKNKAVLENKITSGKKHVFLRYF